YAGIEARGTAWCAGEQNFLDLVKADQDVYLAMASKIYGRSIIKKGPEREVGKAAVLGCGYGLGAEGFASTCKQKGVSVAAAGVTPEQVVEAYRAAYPRIPRLWKNVEMVARAAVLSGESQRVGHCWFAREGDTLVATLPSGRRLHYRNARVELRETPWGERRPSVIYDSPEASHTKRKKGRGGHGHVES